VQSMREDFGKRFASADIDREHNRFKIMAQLEVRKQLFQALIPIGDHTQAVATLTQRCQRRFHIVIDMPSSSLSKTLVERIEELWRERSRQVRSKDLFDQGEPGREGVVEALLDLPRFGEGLIERFGRERTIPQFSSDV